MNLAANLPGVGCFRHATIVHEWMHILGFLHMHSTYNRDDYVDIIEENVAPGQLAKLTACLHYYTRSVFSISFAYGRYNSANVTSINIKSL